MKISSKVNRVKDLEQIYIDQRQENHKEIWKFKDT